MKFAIALLLICTALTGCQSPEAKRPPGGRGGDVGNRSSTVEMHEGSQPFWKTPERIPGEHPSLQSARQADRLSRQ
jgi:hypothetical protein